MRASLRLSYRYLAPGAARMFRLLGLLSVPDFAAWAGAALLDIEPAEAEDLVEELVDAQLLEPLSAGSDGQVRYRFQELPRLFARECANAEESEDDRRGAVRRAYGGWFGLAREAHRRVYGGNFTVVRNPSAPHPLPARLVDTPVGWFETERASIAALVEQASQDDGAGSYAWGLTSLSVTFFQSGNYLEDWRRCAELSLEAVRRDGDPLGEAVMLHSLSTLEIVQWDHDGARERQRLALELFEKLGERQGCALVLRNMAMCERHQGEPDRAAVIGREALENFRSVGDLYGEAYMLGLLAQIELERGEAAASLELSAEAIVRGRALGSGRGEAQSSVRLAEALTRLGEAAKAEKACRRALELVRESGDVRGEAHALRALGEALWGQGRTAEAESVLLEGLSVACEVPDRFLEGRAAAVLGCLLALRGDKPGAVDRLRTAARLFAEVGPAAAGGSGRRPCSQRWTRVARRMRTVRPRCRTPMSSSRWSSRRGPRAHGPTGPRPSDGGQPGAGAGGYAEAGAGAERVQGSSGVVRGVGLVHGLSLYGAERTPVHGPEPSVTVRPVNAPATPRSITWLARRTPSGASNFVRWAACLMCPPGIPVDVRPAVGAPRSNSQNNTESRFPGSFETILLRCVAKLSAEARSCRKVPSLPARTDPATPPGAVRDSW